MNSGLQVPQQKLIQIAPLPQFVPSRACFSCDVCCRFPEEDSFLRPYFTAEEIQRAVSRGLDPMRFPEPTGCQISLVPSPSGEGYICPAFDPSTSHCRIYDVRPLDCQIYPLALMWSVDRSEVLLGWDTKCPFLRESADEGQGVRGEGLESGEAREAKASLGHQPSAISQQLPPPGIRAYADQIAALIERDETIETFAQNPRLVGPFQDDVVILRSLSRLSERLTVRPEAADLPSHALPLTPHRSLLTVADRPLVEQALASTDWAAGTPLAMYAFAPHFIWREQFSYWRADIAGHLCLFAEYQDGIFMPLPPLLSRGTGLAPREAYLVNPIQTLHASRTTLHEGRFTLHAEHRSSFANALAGAFAFMRERNRGSAVTRVENVPEELKSSLEALGYRLTPKDPDYLYRAEELAKLAGDRYKSQRAACNRFQRIHRYRYEPYQPEQAEACLALYRRWVVQQEARDLQVVGVVARQMLKDSASAHQTALAYHRDLGLAGYVVWVDDAIQAYTFGFERTSSVWCVLLEVADRSVPGLAQFLFRECCRDAADRGYAFINSMDDSGLPSLGRSKKAYHPLRLVPNYVLSEAP